MAEHLTPTEMAREFCMERCDVITKCLDLGVPIYQGRINKRLFAAALTTDGGPISSTHRPMEKRMRTEDGEEIIKPDTYNVDGKNLYVFLVGTEEIGHTLWACMAYDHGPHCRLCQEVDGMLNALLVNVLDGRMICKQGPDGQFTFKVTQAGKDAVKAMVADAAEDD